MDYAAKPQCHPHPGRLADATGGSLKSTRDELRMDTLENSHRKLTDLFSLEYIFSQNGLLTSEKFREACERRGLQLLWINANEQLEALHRADVLVPMYRVAKDTRTLRRIARQEGLPASSVMAGSFLLGQRLDEAYADGRVFDPRDAAFMPWRRFESVIDGTRVQKSEFAFSPYQLLLIPNMKQALARMQWHRTRSGNHRAHLMLSEHMLKRLQQDRQHYDELIIALSALDRIYRPLITHVVSLPGAGSDANHAWEDFEDSFDPASMLAWLGWSAERVQEEAEHLIHIASSLDPLDDWLPLIRLCRPEKWERLRGDALVVMDHRIAAEILLRFYEDLAAKGVAPALPEIPRFASHPLKERLKSDRHDLDAVLMDFGLSPHPSLVLFLEGETEMYIVPKVIELLKMRWPRSFIDIQNAHGTQANIGRYASYMAPLTFGEAHGDFVELTRPATRFIVVFDPENAFANSGSAEEERQAWITELFNVLPTEYRTDSIRETIDAQIEVITWEDGSFEFAHFANEELINAINAACHRLGIPVKVIEEWVIQDARSRKRSIETIFPGRAKKRLSKAELAKELYILLEPKIQRAIEEDKLDSIPLLRVLKKALDQAIGVHRSDVGVPLRDGANIT